MENTKYNWYVRYSKKEKEYLPYIVKRVRYDEEEDIPGMEGERVYALSPQQAYIRFMQLYSAVSVSKEKGYDIIVRIDKEEMDRLKRIEENRKKDEEEFIQDAWWNK